MKFVLHNSMELARQVSGKSTCPYPQRSEDGWGQASPSAAMPSRETDRPQKCSQGDKSRRRAMTQTGGDSTVLISNHKKIPIRAISGEYGEFLQTRPLTKREIEILRLIVQGNTNNEIAANLNLTDGTIKSHVRNILEKLGVRDRTQAAVLALRAGLAD